MNWWGTPLFDLATIVSLIGATHSRAGLHVRAELDCGRYPAGVAVTDAHMATERLSSIASMATGITRSDPLGDHHNRQLLPDRPLGCLSQETAQTLARSRMSSQCEPAGDANRPD